MAYTIFLRISSNVQQRNRSQHLSLMTTLHGLKRFPVEEGFQEVVVGHVFEKIIAGTI